MLYYPGKVRLYLTCPHLSGEGPADRHIVHREAETRPGDRQLNLKNDKLANDYEH